MLGWGKEWSTFAIPFASRLTWLPSPWKWAASSRPSTQALLFTAIDSSPLHWSLLASHRSGCDLAPDSQLWLLFIICPWIMANDFSVPHFSLPSSPQSICLLISDHFQGEPTPAGLSGKPQAPASQGSAQPAESPAGRNLDISGCWNPGTQLTDVGLIRLHSWLHSKSYPLTSGSNLR